ncbi:hypothetical protein IMSHALPRED_004410 [Imshaugia aleurites]|uniref:BZIP domain-containing protein n=1 Tax=Imshaugia aleurites TaxID=172621 RepID=A0A8H3IHD3_9LECA|nr:hypothetical protein IMSHALPRED_004410 [Imshaugia aleurites]
MTTFKREPSEASPAGGCFDPDSFINYDQTVVPTPSISPLSTHADSVSTPTPSTAGLASQYQIQPTQQFAGPSHQYEQYRQQAGLPVGALANTFALNQVDQFSYGRSQQFYGTMPPSDGYFGMGMNTSDDYLDFGSALGLGSSIDMDLDFNNSPTTDLPVLNSSFVNPAAVGGSESTPRSLPSQSHPGRVWPGMHQQQAALAKAQAAAQEQQQQQRTMATQKPLPSTHSHQASRSSESTAKQTKPPTDPIVEESISRLLNQMRHSSVASSNDDAATTTGNGNLSNSARMRKDEEEMDEDERLLASEEGKKLSSKERRQLRNKVSARAFRSRRKGMMVAINLAWMSADVKTEYIGQLEGEIAVKVSEADELRAKNEELVAENTRLTDLTRMLLSSPAFSSFLNDLSGTGVPASMPEITRSHSQTSASRPQSAAPRKDVNPNQATPRPAPSQTANTHVGMTVIPEENRFQYNATESANNGWTDSNMDFGGLYDAQVYAVTELPQGPAVDSMSFAMLHGKRSNFVGSYSSDESKDEPAEMPSMPVLADKVEAHEVIERRPQDVDIDASDPAFALFIDRPCTSSPPAPMKPEDRIFGDIELEKAFGRLELVVAEDPDDCQEISSATIERFERLCSRLDAASTRVAAITSHL